MYTACRLKDSSDVAARITVERLFHSLRSLAMDPLDQSPWIMEEIWQSTTDYQITELLTINQIIY